MKLEVVEDIVNRIEFAKQRTGLPYKSLRRAMEISHRTFRRWRLRKQSGKPEITQKEPWPRHEGKLSKPDCKKTTSSG
ncbi:MAG TPA: hypothetical protein VLX68_11810 [Chitinivibrionales bacterium]|nr:hypothetical protein [Chitinivibrionales bacterium]